jgi:sodium/proline symporter
MPGAAFGPLILFALFSKRTTWQAALAGMVVGTVVLVVWKQTHLSERMYEIVPGFIANCAIMILINTLLHQRDEVVLNQYDEVACSVKGR